MIILRQKLYSDRSGRFWAGTKGALKGAGDVRFPVLYGIFSNWGIMVLGSYILGIKMGLGLVGFFLAIGTDETTRGLVMLLRWKSRRWESHSLI